MFMRSTQVSYFKDIQALLKGLRTVDPRMSDFHIHKHEDTPETHLSETMLFRSDVYSVVYLQQGEAYYRIGLSEYHMKAGSLYFNGAQHLRCYRKLSDWQGYVVLFTEEFLNQKGFVDLAREFPFFRLDANVLLAPNEQQESLVQSLLEQIHYFYHSSERASQEILFHYLNILLHYAKNIHAEQHPANEGEITAKPVLLAKSFERLLEEHFFQVAKNQTNRIYSVNDMADHLSITPNHLSEVVKNYFGKTPTQLIKERLILEAKALLSSTELSVSEIAYFLHFKDSSNFSKFFRSHTQTSPSGYRLSR